MEKTETEKEAGNDNSISPLAQLLGFIDLQEMVFKLGKLINILAGKPIGTVMVVFDPDDPETLVACSCTQEKDACKIIPALRSAADQLEKQLSSAGDGDKVH